MELFLFAAAIIQNFDILPPPGVDLSDDKIEHKAGLFIVPADRKLIYRTRK